VCFSAGKYDSRYCGRPHTVGQSCEYSTTYVIIPCAEDLYCNMTDKTCHAPEPAGGTCAADSQCHSQHCYKRVCEPGDPQPAQCREGSCAAGTYCEQHRNPAQCTPLLENGAPCIEHASCRSGVCCGLVCVDGTC
jgi:hypothetical protein